MRLFSGRAHGRFQRPRRRVRAGVTQLLCVLAGLVLGLLLPRITAWPTVASTLVTESLVAVGFGVLGLVTVIFSLLFLVVQWAFGSLSPRLNLFRDDPIVWRTFGLAVGAFVFTITAALVIGNDPKVSVSVPITEVAAVLAAVAMLRILQLKAFASIQLAPTLSAIAAQGRGALSPAVNDPATAVDVLDTIESLLAPLASRDLDVACVTDNAGAVRVVLALPSWDDYLQVALDDLIEAASRSPMVLLRARVLLSGLLAIAPPQRQPSVTWRLHRAEELAADNFPAIWHDATAGRGGL